MAEVKRRRKTAVAGIAPNEPERDILDQYLYEVSTYPLLKGTEEIEVARRIRAGDPDALQELVQRNLRFVISVAKKYQNRGMVIYAVTNGLLDQIPVNRLKDWERGFLEFAEKQFPQVPQRIRTDKVLSKESEADLKRAIEGFNQQFNPEKR